MLRALSHRTLLHTGQRLLSKLGNRKSPMPIKGMKPPPELPIDNRLGTPSSSGVPAQALTECMSKIVLDRRIVGYADDNTAPADTRRAIATDHANTYKSGQDINENNVFVHGGATIPATMIAQTLIFRESEKAKAESRETLPVKAFALSPYYALYPETNERLGIKNEIIKVNNPKDDKETLAHITKALEETSSDQPISLMTINPNNPTGHIYSREFIEGLLALAKKHTNLHIIQDEVYDHIIPSKDGISQKKEMISLFKEASEDLKDRIFEVNSLSKSISYPGLRAGWMITSEKNIDTIKDEFDPLYGQVSADVYLAILSVLSKELPKEEQMSPKYYAEMNKVYHNKLTFLQESVLSISKDGQKISAPMPDGAFYLWADFKPLVGGNTDKADALVKEFVKRAKEKDPQIFLKDGKTTGEAGHIRFNASAASDELQILGDRFVEIAQEMGFDIDESARKTELVSETEISDIAVRNSGETPRMKAETYNVNLFK